MENFPFLASALVFAFAFALRLFTRVFACVCVCVCVCVGRSCEPALHSHVDKRYKDCLLTTMIHRASQLSSTPIAFSAECNKLRSTFLNLDYPIDLVNPAFNTFVRNIDNIDAVKSTRDDSFTIMVPLPFKDQQSALSRSKCKF